MKAKLIVAALFLFIVNVHAQFVEEVILKDYDITTNDVTKIKQSSVSFNRAESKFDAEVKIDYTFDVNGYVASYKDFSYTDGNKIYTYDKAYSKQTTTFDSSAANKYDATIVKMPYATFLLKNAEIIKNPNGSLKKIVYKKDPKRPNDAPLEYNYSYANNIITVTPSDDILNKQRFSADNLLVSSENKMISLYSFYRPKTRLLSQKVSKMSGVSADVYFIYAYEYDKKGNWIVRYEFTSVPEYGTRGNGVKGITVRELTYKDNSKTGYTTVSNDMMTKARTSVNGLKVTKLDSNNPYSFPAYLDFDSLLNASSISSNSNSLDSKCKGNCSDGWGKFTYDNGYYEGFWKNGKKEGYGLYVWNNGNKYQGNWENDKSSGYGYTFFSSGDEYYGSYANGYISGKGMYYIGSTKKTEFNEYSNGKYIKALVLTNNGVATGCLNGDCNNGFGYYKFSNGDTFLGEFSNGSLRRGNYIFGNGDIYQGDFNTSNQFSGFGKYTYKTTGDYYIGAWMNGTRKGRGLYSTDESFSVGEWDGTLKQDLLVK